MFGAMISISIDRMDLTDLCLHLVDFSQKEESPWACILLVNRLRNSRGHNSNMD